MPEEKNLEGLGVWLTLVGIGIIFSPFTIAIESLSIYPEMFLNQSLSALTTPGTEVYNPFWAPILYGEMIINAGFVFAWIFIAVLFFSKKKIFPKCFIGIAIVNLIIIFIDALAVKLVLPNEPIFNAETSGELGRSLILCIIWIPYMLLSKRVKATFVK